MAKIDIARKPNESALAYHKRIVYGKLVDKTLGDVDYTELSELAYGQSYSSDVARRMFYGSKRTLELISAEEASKIDDVNILSELDEKMIELRKERQKFYDQRNAFNKIVRERSRQEELNEIIIDAIHNGELPRLNYERNIIEPSSNDLLVSLNDLHYGAVHSNYWNEYNSDIAKDMMANYLDRIINIADTHNSENCIVWENGDAISGAIHRSIQITNKENVIEQVMGASELIAEFIAELSKHFRTVKFVSVSGNHSRIDPNKDNALVDERLDDLIEWYIAARLQNFENVEIGAGEKIDSTMYLIDIRGKNYCGIHGDFDGSASKVQSLQTMVGRPVYAVLSGHMHHNKVDEVQGVKTVMAGSFLGMDDYCVQKRIYGKPEQMVCVCDENGIVCHYDIPLTK
nr:MAG TPA: DNA polymerase II small subunit [Caudoviricetes sp.]